MGWSSVSTQTLTKERSDYPPLHSFLLPLLTCTPSTRWSWCRGCPRYLQTIAPSRHGHPEHHPAPVLHNVALRGRAPPLILGEDVEGHHLERYGDHTVNVRSPTFRNSNVSKQQGRVPGFPSRTNSHSYSQLHPRRKD